MKAIVTGSISGQDGHYMVQLLESKGWEVYRMKRPELIRMRMKRVLRQFKPDVVYNFAGISNVFDPYENVDRLFDVNGRIPQHFLEAIQIVNPEIKFFQASSCLTLDVLYPYGAAKLYADNMVKMFRKDYGLFACSGILYPHESIRRGDNFFTKKVTNAAKKKEGITLATIQGQRDWGFAGDYVEAAYAMMQQEVPRDYQIGTGVLTDLEYFVKKSYEVVGLDYRDYVRTKNIPRRNDADMVADISEIKKIGWQPKHNVDDIINMMMKP